jgi:hypothetical protein
MGSMPHSSQLTTSRSNYAQLAIGRKEAHVNVESEISLDIAVKVRVTLALILSVVLG